MKINGNLESIYGPRSNGANVQRLQQERLEKMQRDKVAGQNHRAAGSSAAEVNISTSARALAEGLEMLKESEDVIRPEMVERAKQMVNKWNPLDDAQVDKIIDDMFSEL